ncbi:MAG TPA: hypothetical protein VHI52_11175, partial [Verrucomicrobiae bacterium]|nr:hypothetical protein [Verrucomicrobiae bacterium]
RINPPASAALSSGDVVPIYVNVSDSIGVTNATISATINGTNITFLNDGIAPDVFTNDSVYSANFTVPANVSSVRLDLVISAPDKESSTNSITYTVIPPPPNDFFTNAIKVPAGGATYLTSNRKATIETNEPPHGGVPGAAASLWWNYAPLVSGNVLVDAGGSDDITILAVYTNNSLASLQPVASAVGSAVRNGPYVNINAKAGVNYHIALAALNTNDVGTVRFAITPGGVPDTNPPSVLVSSPPSGLVVSQSRLVVSGSAVDPEPNPTGIRSINISVTSLPQSGPETTRTFTIVPPPTADGPTSTNWNAVIGLLEGLNTIKVSATDFAGNKSSQVTVLITYRILDPPNDFFANATILTNNSDVVAGNTLNATKELGEPNHAGNAGGKSAWWNFTAPVDGSLSLSTTNSSFDTLLAVYTGSNVANLTLIASNDDAYEGAAGGFSQLNVAVRAGQTYHIAIDGYDGAGGALFLTYAFSSSQLYHLTVLPAQGGTTSLGSSDFPSNATVVITAIPAAGFQFSSWTGDVTSTANPLTLSVRGNLTISPQFAPVVYTDGFESGNLGHLGWTTSGNAPWFVETNVVASGSYAVRSGVIQNGQSSSLSISTNFQAGSGSFAYKVSSEPSFDVLSFSVDGVVVHQWSGEVDWNTYGFPLTAGPHTLRWTYTKDPSQSYGLDAAFIDNVNLPFGIPIDNTTPARLKLVKMS